MRYDLGLMDMYPFEACGTCVENNPLVKVKLRTKVDPVRLEDALYRAIRFHPLFGTRLRYEGRYFLETNNRPIRLFHAEESKRPSSFGKDTNGYPWQLCWYDRSFTFEWCHGITDGKGAMEFLKTLLSIYCGVKYPSVPRKIMLGPGLEPFVDYKEKGDHFVTQPQGFSIKDMPVRYRDYRTDCHVLEADTREILDAAKKCGGSPSGILTILLSKAIRNHLPENAKNKNVACNLVIDLRQPLHYETMHNCVDYKRFTYQDRHEEMSFEDVAKEYKAELDHARKEKNVIRMVSDRVRLFDALHFIKTKHFTHTAVNIVGKLLKDSDCNCVLTYIGKTDFPKEVKEQVEDFDVRAWHDFGECIFVAVDFEGRFKVNISENYAQKGIVEEFMELSRSVGIHWTNTENLEYVQSGFTEEGTTVIRKKGSEKQPSRELPLPRAERAGSPVYFL